MNGRRSGTREKSRKQALDSAWSMEMSRLARDGTAEPVSRDQILRRERGQGIINFPCSASWPRAGLATLPSCDGHTYKQALHTFRCSYTYMHIQQWTVHECTCPQIKNILVPGIQTNTNSSTDTADHEQVWQPYAVDPFYSAISKCWPFLLAL